jgi:hypothetical protein
MEVSINMGTPKRQVYKGKTQRKIDVLGGPPIYETPICCFEMNDSIVYYVYIV